MIPADIPAPEAALDRHALVLTIWLPAGFVAAALLHMGLAGGPIAALVCAFACVLAAFIGHVIVNAVTDTHFSPRELGLGLVVYLAGLLAFAMSALLSPTVWQGRHWVGVGGFVILALAVLLYLVIAQGLRGAFESFDVIRDFKASRSGADRGTP